MILSLKMLRVQKHCTEPLVKWMTAFFIFLMSDKDILSNKYVFH